jgi:hypothetical protein
MPTSMRIDATARSTLTSHALDRNATGATHASAATNSHRPEVVGRTANHAAATIAAPPKHQPIPGRGTRIARFTTNAETRTTRTNRRDRSALGSGRAGGKVTVWDSPGGGRVSFTNLQRRVSGAALVASPHLERTAGRVQKSHAVCDVVVQMLSCRCCRADGVV